MRQCVLRNHNRIMVAWIPNQFAIKGKWLRILGEDHWQVVELGTFQKDFSYPGNTSQVGFLFKLCLKRNTLK